MGKTTILVQQGESTRCDLFFFFFFSILFSALITRAARLRDDDSYG